MVDIGVQQPEVINNLAVNLYISSKFGVHIIDFDIPKRQPLLKSKPEVNFRLYNRHLEKSI